MTPVAKYTEQIAVGGLGTTNSSKSSNIPLYKDARNASLVLPGHGHDALEMVL